MVFDVTFDICVYVVMTNPKILKRESGRQVYQPRRHLSQMHTTNYMPFIYKYSEPIGGGRPHRPLNPNWLSTSWRQHETNSPDSDLRCDAEDNYASYEQKTKLILRNIQRTYTVSMGRSTINYPLDVAINVLWTV